MRKINPEAYQPLGYRVLIRDEPVPEKVGSIILAPKTKEADEFAQQFGVIVKMGDLAFTMETHSGRYAYASKPNIGDVVNYSKFAGGTYQTDDENNKYRILNDDDVIGVVERKA